MDSGKTDSSPRLSEELKKSSVSDTIINEAKDTMTTIQHVFPYAITHRESREAEPPRPHSSIKSIELSKAEKKAVDALVNLSFGHSTLQTQLMPLTEIRREGTVKREEAERMEVDGGGEARNGEEEADEGEKEGGMMREGKDAEHHESWKVDYDEV